MLARHIVFVNIEKKKKEWKMGKMFLKKYNCNDIQHNLEKRSGSDINKLYLHVLRHKVKSHDLNS